VGASMLCNSAHRRPSSVKSSRWILSGIGGEVTGRPAKASRGCREAGATRA
jgi:hypothetical protein